MKSILDLKKEFKKRNLKITECANSVEELNDFITIDLLKRGNVDASLVALISTTMNIAGWYKKKQFVIGYLHLKKINRMISFLSKNYVGTGRHSLKQNQWGDPRANLAM